MRSVECARTGLLNPVLQSVQSVQSGRVLNAQDESDITPAGVYYLEYSCQVDINRVRAKSILIECRSLGLV